jgi:hypothetical protein
MTRARDLKDWLKFFRTVSKLFSLIRKKSRDHRIQVSYTFEWKLQQIILVTPRAKTPSPALGTQSDEGHHTYETRQGVESFGFPDCHMANLFDVTGKIRRILPFDLSLDIGTTISNPIYVHDKWNLSRAKQPRAKPKTDTPIARSESQIAKHSHSFDGDILKLRQFFGS